MPTIRANKICVRSSVHPRFDSAIVTEFNSRRKEVRISERTLLGSLAQASSDLGIHDNNHRDAIMGNVANSFHRVRMGREQHSRTPATNSTGSVGNIAEHPAADNTAFGPVGNADDGTNFPTFGNSLRLAKNSSPTARIAISCTSCTISFLPTRPIPLPYSP